jgi:hypothetical protein
VDQSTQILDAPSSEAPKVTQRNISAVMKFMGSRGGKIGGVRRRDNMTPAERSASASKAAKARWGGHAKAKMKAPAKPKQSGKRTSK